MVSCNDGGRRNLGVVKGTRLRREALSGRLCSLANSVHFTVGRSTLAFLMAEVGRLAKLAKSANKAASSSAVSPKNAARNPLSRLIESMSSSTSIVSSWRRLVMVQERMLKPSQVLLQLTTNVVT